MQQPSTPSAPLILIVDDSEETSDVMAMALRMEGFNVSVASNGQEALDLLASGQPLPLCMLVDFDMPGMNGLELTRAVRARFQDDIVLIAITGSGDAEDPRRKELFALTDHHFLKPVSWTRLMKVFASLKT